MSNFDSNSELRDSATDTSAVDERPSPYVTLSELSRLETSRTRFLGSVLQAVTRHFQSPYGALHVRFEAEVFQDESHFGPTDPRFWKSSVQSFLTDSLDARRARAKVLRARSGDARVAFISAPLKDDSGTCIGALALVVTSVADDDLPNLLASMEALASMASSYMEVIEAGGVAAGTIRGDDPGGQRAPTSAVASVTGMSSAEELAFTITNELRNKLDAEQIGLGLVKRRRVSVIAISGFDQVNRRSPGVLKLVAAMEECLDACDIIAYPPSTDSEGEKPPERYRLHKQWHQAARGDCVASLPLCVDSKPVAILTLRSRTDCPISNEQLENIRSKVEPYAASLLIARRAGRTVVRHALDSVGCTWGSLMAPRCYGRKISCVAGVLAALWFCFGTLEYRLTVPGAVKPAEMRQVAAPLEGLLISALVVPGDQVKQGDVLCELDQRPYRQQTDRLQAELEVLVREQDRAMAGDAPAEAQLAVAKQQLVRVKLDIAQSRLERATVRAPIDGVVTAGDLRKSVGVVLALGDPLFTIAPLGQWALELDVPESRVADLETGFSGVFASHSRPDLANEFEIVRVRPSSEPRGSGNVYVAEARPQGEVSTLRLGVEGVARIEMGSRRVWWIALHRVVEYLQLNHLL